MPLRISMEWLREYIELPEPAEQLADRLTLSGTEVEQVISLGSGWEGVQVVRAVEVEVIPGSEGLQRAVIEAGDRHVQVASKAPNLRVGDLLAWAPPGTTLPDGTTIRERKMMGHAAHGMLLSPVELGISGEADGLLVLGTEGPTGVPLTELMPADQVMVVEVTTNRPDLLCHLGIARELSALLSRPLRNPPAGPVEDAQESPLTVEITDPDLCPRYQARYLPGVVVGPSPAWLARRLRAVGQKPISNVVDAGNYAMFETGQPLHAFDAGTLREGIVVRLARRGEEIDCLDGVVRTLHETDLVIADHAGPVAIAGIIGGANSAVSPATTSVLIESACFKGTSVRNTSRRLAVRTEASTRFEKQLSPELTGPGAARMAALLQVVAGGAPSSPVVDVYPKPWEREVIRVTPGYVERLLGVPVDDREVAGTLRSLQFEVEEQPTALAVTQPPFRVDVRAAVDIVEEVGRLRGYNSLPSTLPGRRMEVASILPPPDPEWAGRDIAMGAGFDEAVTSSWSAPDDPLVGTHAGERVRVLNPMSRDQAEMRRSLGWGLARAVARNVAWGNAGVRLFELGRVFRPVGGEELPEERRFLGLALHLPQGRAASAAGTRAALLEVKGVLELVASELSAGALDVGQAQVPGLHPGRAATITLAGHGVGSFGQLHPDLQRLLDVPGGLVVAELDFDALVAQGREIRYRLPSRFPAVLRDLSLSVPVLTPAGDVVAAISGAGEVILRTVELFDEYHGGQVEQGRKGLAFRLVFQSDERTLTGDEVAGAEKRIAAMLAGRFSATLRE